MAAKHLSPDDIALGRAVLLATDALGMHAEGAFWLYDKADKEWRYFLITSLFERIGPREVYVCLNEALAKILSEREAIDLQIYIASPSEELVKQLFAQVRTAHRVSDPRRFNVKVNGGETDSFIYRLAEGLETNEARKIQRRFRQSCKELATTA